MKYSLRSLMIVVLVAPPLLALAWWAVQPQPRVTWEEAGKGIKSLGSLGGGFRSEPSP